jgi:Zn-dependent metalloprotease
MDSTIPPGHGRTLHSGVVPLNASVDTKGKPLLVDRTRGGSFVTEGRAFLGAVPTDANGVWGEDTDSVHLRAALDAYYAMQQTWDFFRDVLGRNSYDDRGTRMKVAVNSGLWPNNAEYSKGQVTLGWGDGFRYGPMVALDVVAHELAHGLVESTAGLYTAGMPGVLNESMADIFATGVEWYASQRNPDVEFDWSIGEDTVTPKIPGDAMRYLDDPSRDGSSPDHWKQVDTENDIHLAAAIGNQAFYLLSQGGTNRTSGLKVEEGVGIERALRIFCRALTNHLSRNAGFTEARAATVKAATELYPEEPKVADAVRAAWNAVGIVEPASP